MNSARMREVVFILFVLATSPAFVSAQAQKESAGPKGVKCCGILMRTDFGNPDRLAELALQPDSVMANCFESGKTKGLVEAFDAYLETVETEFGDAARRDVVRTRLTKVFKSVVNDQTRSASLLEGYKKFAYARLLASRRLNARAIEEVRQSRVSLLRAVPEDSFCLMPLDLYLATILSEAGEHTESMAITQSVIARARKAYSKRDDFVGLAVGVLGKVQMAAGKPKLAEESLRESISILSESLEIQPATYLISCTVLAESMAAQSKNAEVAELMAYLDPQIRKHFRNQPVPPVFEAVALRSKALIAIGKFDDAEKVLGKYPEMMQSLRDPGIPARDLLDAYVNLLEKTDRPDQAAAYRKRLERIESKLPVATRKTTASIDRD